MEQEINDHELSITWRGKKYVVTMNLSATIEELDHELQKLTAVKADMLKLIVQSHEASKLLSPFSDEHSSLTLQETSIEWKPIRMMGVPQEEVGQVLKRAKTDMTIAGFDEEERRMRQRMSNRFDAPLQLPSGNYVFGGFKTLELLGIELYPPPSETFRLMHTVAADKGIVAIMNKKWLSDTTLKKDRQRHGTKDRTCDVNFLAENMPLHTQNSICWKKKIKM